MEVSEDQVEVSDVEKVQIRPCNKFVAPQVLF